MNSMYNKYTYATPSVTAAWTDKKIIPVVTAAIANNVILANINLFILQCNLMKQTAAPKLVTIIIVVVYAITKTCYTEKSVKYSYFIDCVYTLNLAEISFCNNF
jgi:hypothetical protein